jgi:hypothetical protein
MNKIFTDRFTSSYVSRKSILRARLRKYTKVKVTIDIALISAAIFHRNCQEPEATPFIVTLEAIDREIYTRENPDELVEATNEELVARKLPSK